MSARKIPTKHSEHQSLFGDAEAAREKPTTSKGELIVAHVDGGARGNPGPAGFGVFITDGQGKMLAELSEYLGHKTNNFAEYSGLLAALDFAVKHGHSRLQVVSDSELMVKQMNGAYKVRSPELKELYDRARVMVRKLERFDIRHVLRAGNKDADRLANEAMDRGSGRSASSATQDRRQDVAATAGGTPSVPVREVNGIVRDGVVEFLGETLPEGTVVKVRRR